MKTLVLATVSTAALLTAGAAFAAGTTAVLPTQTNAAGASSSVEQTGVNNRADVDQINASIGTSVVVQGTPNTASLGQTPATNNVAYVKQDGTTGATRARIVQGNMSKPTTATGNDTVVYNGEYGSGVTIYGSKSTGPTNTGSAFTAASNAGFGTAGQLVNPGGDFFPDDLFNPNSYTTINSPAASLAAATTMANRAETRQSGQGADALTYQYGNGNSAYITQSGVTGGSAMGMGAMNGVAQVSAAEAVAATGDNNSARVLSAATVGGAAIVQDQAIGDTATVVQNNASNGARVTQFQAALSTASVTQSGSSSKALVAQRQSNNVDASIIQASSSTGNVAAIDQLGSSFNTSVILQKASSSQGEAYSFQGGTQQYSSIDQSGQKNQADVWQGQLGSTNVSLVTQTSNGTTGNMAKVAQDASSTWSLVAQNGNGNTAYVNQMRGGALHFSR